ncbi:MAG: biotin/lipoyl-containing protein, partial [candidate division Zixibacteria bacterium]|nr:biotin/lipoyl-containing protein [candidate division Zixibacteria bacterium]
MSNFEFVINGDTITSVCEKQGDNLKVKVGDSEFLFRPIGTNLYSTTLNGHTCTVGVVENNGTCYIDIDSVLLEVTEPSEDGFTGGAGAQAGENDKILAPMPGKIVKINVNVGDEVTVKQALVIVEAMKMENVVVSRAVGKVKAINFAPGDQVDTETPIIELELAE